MLSAAILLNSDWPQETRKGSQSKEMEKSNLEMEMAWLQAEKRSQETSDDFSVLIKSGYIP